MIETPLLQLQNVSKRFDGQVLFHSVNLELRAGEIVVIVGPSGVGKSTLLKMISGLTSYEGDIFIKGQRVVFDPAESGTKQVTVVTQKPGLWEHLRVLENVALVRRLLIHESAQQARSKAREILRKLEVDELSQRFPATLSGGEQQRVAIARGFSTERPLLLLDEVMASVDSRRKQLIIDAVRRVAEAGMGILAVTHDVESFESTRARVCSLSNEGLSRDAHD